mmetsp:Transcript_22431/g.58571  ORF Transcript_22431/g.58571 Transcript_22431/m.58571 type:complete len:380 (+) Transcript_22431:73-1212(+)
MVTRVKVICLPVYQRQWMWHAYTSTTEELKSSGGTSSNARLLSTDESPGTLGQKLQEMQAQLSSKCQTTVSNQWAAMQTAGEGTFKHWMYKFARGVLAREDPAESFLKQLPADADQFEVIYPSSLDQALVRRRLRLTAYSGVQRHKRRALGWGLFSFPQVPLVFTPFPNVTVYYCIYRAISHYRALNGAKALKSAFTNPESARVQHLLNEAVPENKGPKGDKGAKSKGRGKGSKKASAPTAAGTNEQLGELLQRLQLAPTALSLKVGDRKSSSNSCSISGNCSSRSSSGSNSRSHVSFQDVSSSSPHADPAKSSGFHDDDDHGSEASTSGRGGEGRRRSSSSSRSGGRCSRRCRLLPCACCCSCTSCKSSCCIAAGFWP